MSGVIDIGLSFLVRQKAKSGPEGPPSLKCGYKPAQTANQAVTQLQDVQSVYLAMHLVSPATIAIVCQTWEP
jgi:hypothetical protein